MEKYKFIEKGLRDAGKLYIELLRDELAYQDHNASNRLSDGFYIRIHKRGGSLVMDVMNNAPYMWTVNDGDENGVNVDIDDIKKWMRDRKWTFDDADHEGKVSNKIASELRTKYLTEGGEKVASRRYYFINIAFDEADRMGLNAMVEEEIRNQIDLEVGEIGKSKAIQLTIS